MRGSENANRWCIMSRLNWNFYFDESTSRTLSWWSLSGSLSFFFSIIFLDLFFYLWRTHINSQGKMLQLLNKWINMQLKALVYRWSVTDWWSVLRYNMNSSPDAGRREAGDETKWLLTHTQVDGEKKKSKLSLKWCGGGEQVTLQMHSQSIDM